MSAVERMDASDVLVVLLEFDPDSAGRGLFSNENMPASLAAGDFSPSAMPRTVPGRTAAQWFFSLAGRAFCLYVVLGSHRDRGFLLPVATAWWPRSRSRSSAEGIARVADWSGHRWVVRCREAWSAN